MSEKWSSPTLTACDPEIGCRHGIGEGQEEEAAAGGGGGGEGAGRGAAAGGQALHRRRLCRAPRLRLLLQRQQPHEAYVYILCRYICCVTLFLPPLLRTCAQCAYADHATSFASRNVQENQG